MSITQVRTALASVITTAVPALNGYHTVPDVTQVPAVVVRPGHCNFVVGMGNCQEWIYEVYVLVARTDSVINQDQLDTYLSATGASSVVAAIRANPTLGLTNADAVVFEMTKYGGSWESARISHIGAQLNVRVLITE